jgi:hypothetical protein
VVQISFCLNWSRAVLLPQSSPDCSVLTFSLISSLVAQSHRPKSETESSCALCTPLSSFLIPHSSNHQVPASCKHPTRLPSHLTLTLSQTNEAQQLQLLLPATTPRTPNNEPLPTTTPKGTKFAKMVCKSTSFPCSPQFLPQSAFTPRFDWLHISVD